MPVLLVLLVGLVLIAIAFAFRLRDVPAPPRPIRRVVPSGPLSRERRLLEIFHRLPRSDKATVVMLLAGALVGTTFGLYALVLRLW